MSTAPHELVSLVHIPCNNSSAGGLVSNTPIPLITPPALHDISVLLNLIVAVKFAEIHCTPSVDKPPLESISLPDTPFQEREIFVPLGTAHVTETFDPNVMFIEAGNSENTALLPVGGKRLIQ